MSKHVVFIEPRFPGNQRHFVRALAEVGARVSDVGVGGEHSRVDDHMSHLVQLEHVSTVDS